MFAAALRDLPSVDLAWQPDVGDEDVPDALAAGANIIGSCCGSTPEHTRAIRGVVEKFNRK